MGCKIACGRERMVRLCGEDDALLEAARPASRPVEIRTPSPERVGIASREVPHDP